MHWSWARTAAECLTPFLDVLEALCGVWLPEMEDFFNKLPAIRPRLGYSPLWFAQKCFELLDALAGAWTGPMTGIVRSQPCSPLHPEPFVSL